VETWSTPDSSAAVMFELSPDATGFEISGVQGFERVPGTLQCAARFAGTPAPFRMGKFVRIAPTPETLYVAQSELALSGRQTLFAVAAGRGPAAMARALGVVATVHLR